MGKIIQLSKHVSELIAAGEVVERPASVIKELVENAIDAGALEIVAEIRNGGVTYLRISDDGCGMSEEDACLAFSRHATSKISSQDDLYSIKTLGFRGEALCAIAAVSKVELRTSQDGIEGTLVKISGGVFEETIDYPATKGTTIIIRDIFYNVPARMKFLKKDVGEGNLVTGIMQKIAVSYPNVSFKFIRDNKEIFMTSGNGDLLEAIYSVYGKELSKNMQSVGYELSEVVVSGYISKPQVTRGNRTMQLFFVNGRYVKSQLLQAALEQAYRNNIPSGKFPSCVLAIEISYELVDVNVHPAKTEIKFHNDKSVFNAVYVACKNAIESMTENAISHTELTKKQPEIVQDNITEYQQKIISNETTQIKSVAEQFAQPKKTEILDIAQNLNTEDKPSFSVQNYISNVIKPRTVNIDIEFDDNVESNSTLNLSQDYKAFYESPRMYYPNQEESSDVDAEEIQLHTIVAEPVENELKEELFFDDVKVLGECFGTYILSQYKEELLLIDKHAAHERILFNKLKAEYDGTASSQLLLSPLVIDLPFDEFALITEQLDVINKLGFDMEIFGKQSIIVREVPSYLDRSDVKILLNEIITNISKNFLAFTDKADKIIHSVACRAAIKANYKTTLTEMEQLSRRVISDSSIACCPHGRPVVIKFTKYEFEKMFKRTGH